MQYLVTTSIIKSDAVPARRAGRGRFSVVGRGYRFVCEDEKSGVRAEAGENLAVHFTTLTKVQTPYDPVAVWWEKALL